VARAGASASFRVAQGALSEAAASKKDKVS